ncbi:hypothetical protein WN943_015323 [Citrus x changshan-huyou]
MQTVLSAGVSKAAAVNSNVTEFEQELKQLENRLERGITRISSKKAPISRSVTTTPIKSRSVTTTPVRLLDHDPPPNNLPGYDSGLIYN